MGSIYVCLTSWRISTAPAPNDEPIWSQNTLSMASRHWRSWGSSNQCSKMKGGKKIAAAGIRSQSGIAIKAGEGRKGERERRAGRERKSAEKFSWMTHHIIGVYLLVLTTLSHPCRDLHRAATHTLPYSRHQYQGLIMVDLNWAIAQFSSGRSHYTITYAVYTSCTRHIYLAL